MFTFALLPSIGMQELIIILVLVLIIFGPGKLPEVGKAIGRGIREFRKASTDAKKELEEATDIAIEKRE
ncbi:Sec-independent protein translocase subunit TatA/TatB [Calderihabitans maritimus]|uniref:Sec-independent protein translocase protein TatA n=1 Tax=Calderihabitans maritimus TaxID=1246530 RepID=A0A1Z5HNI9_9FIRM|nr:twin-arginine translocase TatA/TatE family subunit [Calderihabitans maritimus]GAW91092.1 twin-arginine translocation protein, TatA/E family subunit [Calderihabitans maritimus]